MHYDPVSMFDWVFAPWRAGGTQWARFGRIAAVSLTLALVLVPSMALYFGIDGFWWDNTASVVVVAPIGVMLFDALAELASRIRGRRISGVPRVAVLAIGAGVGVLGGYACTMLLFPLPGRTTAMLLADFRRTIGILAPVVIIGTIAGASLWYRAEAFRQQTAAAIANFSVLQQQMQPHFLFNALSALKELIADDPSRARAFTQQLADLYRSIMKVSGDATAPLVDELAIVTSYCEVERVRFGDRLRYTIDAPADLGRLHVPSLMLQTLVENAIKHGISKARTGRRGPRRRDAHAERSARARSAQHRRAVRRERRYDRGNRSREHARASGAHVRRE